MTGLIKPDAELSRLNAEIDKRNQLVDNIKALQTIYSDLMIYKPYDDESYHMYCAESANKIVDDYDYIEREEELEDSEGYIIGKVSYIDIWPYMITDDGSKLHSNPPCFTVGEVNDLGFGLVPYQNWDDMLSDVNIDVYIIRRVRNYLKSKPPIYY